MNDKVAWKMPNSKQNLIFKSSQTTGWLIFRGRCCLAWAIYDTYLNSTSNLQHYSIHIECWAVQKSKFPFWLVDQKIRNDRSRSGGLNVIQISPNIRSFCFTDPLLVSGIGSKIWPSLESGCTGCRVGPPLVLLWRTKPPGLERSMIIPNKFQHFLNTTLFYVKKYFCVVRDC